MTGTHEEDLVRRCVVGDHAAWGILEETYGSKVSRWMARFLARGGHRTSDLEVAELRQEVFTRLLANDYRALRSWRGISSFEGWLTGVASNVFRDHLRRVSPGERRAFPLGLAQERLPDPGPYQSRNAVVGGRTIPRRALGDPRRELGGSQR